MINRIELIQAHEMHQMRKLNRDNPLRRQEDFEPSDEIIQVRHVRQDIIADDQVRTPFLRY